MRALLLTLAAADGLVAPHRAAVHLPGHQRATTPTCHTPAGGSVASAPLSPVISSSRDASAAPSEPEKEQFQWFKQWYPIAVTEYMDPTRPHTFTLLGRSIVLWNDGPTIQPPKRFGLFQPAKQKQAGKWRVFVDACPHRMAPLSEGRVEDTGELLCAYHAWRFDSAGACTAIPQSPKALEKAHMADPKASCGAMPTMEADGLLWVWPDTSPNAALEAFAFETAPAGSDDEPGKLRKPSLIPELHDPALSARVKQLPWNTRELPYGWDFFMENVMDPAHVPVSHHGITGSRYKEAQDISLHLGRHVSTNGGFSFNIDPAGPFSLTNDFRPPALQQITQNFPGGGKMILGLYAVPTRPGYCRHIGCQILVKNEEGKFAPGIGIFATPMPKWLAHIAASTFLHQDASFLHHQEKILAEHGYMATSGSRDDYVDKVYTPNPADKNIITFRRWLRSRAGGGVPWPRGTGELPTRSCKGEVYDVYHSHVKDCSYCSAALHNLRIARASAYGTSALCVALSSQIGLTNALGLAFASAGAGEALGMLIGMFYAYEFSHADND
jgi:phenylpropionate dioxygenase-like ring-hydroxylating dioxygenase large terminal subunit